jgi:hypothetical protein
LIPTFGAHRVPSSKTTLNMQPTRSSQHLHPDKGSPQPTTQTLPTILELQLQQIDMPTMAAGTSQTGVGTSSMQTNGDDQVINNPLPPPPSQVNQGEIDLDQIEIHDWDEADEAEAEAQEHEQ